MSYSRGPAKISVSVFDHNSIHVDLFRDGEELLQHYVSKNSSLFSGGWGSHEHIAGLFRLQKDLNETIKSVCNLRISERGE